jgi:hypothetical protein
MVSTKVVLPAPFGPTMVHQVPLGTSIETSSKRVADPARTLNSRIDMELTTPSADEGSE